MNPTFSMSPTVDNCRKVGQYRPQPRVTMEQCVAQLTGCEPGTAHQWAVGAIKVNHRAAAVVLGYIAEGRPARAILWAKPITDALAGIRPVSLSLDLAANAQRDDLREDCDENAVRLIDPDLDFTTPEAKQSGLRWAADLERSGTSDLQLAAAIRAKCAAV